MAKATLADAGAVTSTIVAALDPLEVLVFGEVGRTGEGNDLDLLVVVGEEGREGASLDAALKPFYQRFAVDPFIMRKSTSCDHFLHGSPFLRAVIREGRRLHMKNVESEWMKDGREELSAAEHLRNGKFWKLACFHAQQAVEKSLKARLLGKGWGAGKGSQHCAAVSTVRRLQNPPASRRRRSPVHGRHISRPPSRGSRAAASWETRR